MPRSQHMKKMPRRPVVPVSPLTLETLAAACAPVSPLVPENVLPSLAVYLELLLRWNTVMNLVGARSWQSALHNLVLDSFHLAAFLKTLPLPEAPVTWDLGAGAGLPGVPLRMVWQRGSYAMVEAREKRALFLNTVLAQVPLPDTHVFQGRVEAFFPRQPRKADVILSRAFLPWPEVLALAHGQLVPGGCVVFLALDPAPQTPPRPWQILASQRYTANHAERWFWALGEGA